MADGVSENVCGTCRWWHELPRPAGAGGAVDMAVPAAGQCRGGPPSLTVLPTAQGQLNLVDYPTTPAGWPACGRYAGRGDPALLARKDGARWWDRTLADLAAAGREGNGFVADCLRDELALRWRTASAREQQDVLAMLAAVWQQLARVPAAAAAYQGET